MDPPLRCTPLYTRTFMLTDLHRIRHLHLNPLNKYFLHLHIYVSPLLRFSDTIDPYKKPCII